MALVNLVNTTTNVSAVEKAIVASGNNSGVVQVSFIGASPVGTVKLFGRIGDGHPLVQIGADFTASDIREVVPCPFMAASVTGIGGPSTQIIVSVWE